MQLHRSLRWLAPCLERLASGAFIATIALLGYWRSIPLELFPQSWVVGRQYQLVSLFHPQFQMVILYPSDITAGLTVILWLLGRAAALAGGQERPPLRLGPRYLVPPLIGLAVLAALSATQAVLPILSIEIALQLLLVAALMAAIINLRPPLWAIVAPLACLLAIEGVLSLLQVWAQSTLVDRWLFQYDQEITPLQSGAVIVQLPGGTRWLRAYGTYVHPNILGGFLCLALPIVAGAYLRLPWRRRSAWLLLLALLLGMLALLLSFSRAAWLGILVGALCAGWVVWSRRRARTPTPAGEDAGATSPPAPAGEDAGAASGAPWARPVLLGLLCLGLLAGLVAALGPVIQSRLLLSSNALEQRSVDERIVLLEASAFFITGHPWLGVGAGNMPLVEVTYPPARNIGEATHNVPILVATETGLLGLLLWLIPPLGVLWYAWHRRLALSPAALAGTAALVALLIAAQLDHYLWTLSPGIMLWWLALTLTWLWGSDINGSEHAPAPQCQQRQREAVPG